LKRFFLHIVFSFLIASALGQIVEPLGYGLPAKPLHISEYKNGLVAVYVNRSEEVSLSIWNGDFWYELEKPPVPTLGSESGYTISDLKVYNNKVYLSLTSQKDATQPIVLEWDNGNWKNISSTAISSAKTINGFATLNDELYAIGMFTDGNTTTNLLRYNNGSWEATGNTITNNFNRDNFSGIVEVGTKIYATGTFSSPISSDRSLAIWDGNQWSAAEFPPFLGENKTIGTYQDRPVVYGTSNFATAPVKIEQNGVWVSLSNGLEDYTVNEIQHFAETNGYLFALGSFTKTQNNENLNVLLYDGQEWQETQLNLSNIDKITSTGESVYLSGDFEDNSRINYIGNLIPDASQIAAKVYLDKNQNCKKDDDEDWLPNYPLALDKSEITLASDKFGQLYAQVSKGKHTINVVSNELWTSTCPDFSFNATENRTYYGAILGVNARVGVTDAESFITDKKGPAFTSETSRQSTVCAVNNGLQPITNATLRVKLSEGIADFGATVPFNLTDNEAIWQLDLSAYEQKCIDVYYTIEKDQFNDLTASISLQDGVIDVYPENNSTSLRYKTGTDDGNHKFCKNGETIGVGTEELSYKIGFENTAESSSIAVKVVDELDTALRISYKGVSFYTSHTSKVLPVHELMDNGRYRTKLVWEFDNINLKGKNSIENSGYVDFLLNLAPNSLEKGQRICNQAKIYFSYREGSFDEPIFTNNVCGIVGETSSVSSFNDGLLDASKILVTPNPASNYLHIENQTTERIHFTLTDILGRPVAKATVSAFGGIDLNLDLSPGTYTLEGNNQFIQKVLIK
jgi:hypothetical protein